MSNATRKPAPTPRRLQSITASAEYVGCNPRTIRRYIAAGRITGYRVGPRLIRVDLTELDALLRPIPTAGDGALSRGRPVERLTGVCPPKADAELAAGGGR